MQKFLDHPRDLVAVNRRHNADALVTKMQILLVDDLRDAHRLRFQLLCDVQAVACSCKIKYHSDNLLLQKTHLYRRAICAIIRLLYPVDTIDYSIRLLLPVNGLVRKKIRDFLNFL